MTHKYLLAAMFAGLSIFLFGWTDHDHDFANAISGRFILEDSHCAGFNFINKKTVLWTNEMFCNSPDTFKIRWIDKSTFVTRSTERINKSCPPKVEVFKVVSFDGRHLVLSEIWTGWDDYKDDILKFTKRGK